MSGPKFLIVRFSAIGDCVMASYAATSIRARYPDARISWAIEPRCAPVVDRDRLVDDLVLRQPMRFRDLGIRPSAWAEQVRWHMQLRKQRFDFGIDLQGHTKTALCLRLAKPKRRIAARATDQFARRLNPLVESVEPGLHTIEWNLCALRELGDFPTSTETIVPNLRAEIAEIRREVGGKPLATISVGAGQASKAYPVGQWLRVAGDLKRAGYAVALLGGPTDPSPGPCDALDWVGRLDLRRTMAAVGASDLHLAADTGTGHVAAAQNVPVVSVFGPTDPVVYRPYTKNSKVLRNGDQTELVCPDEIVAAAMTLAEGHGATVRR